MRKIFLLTLLLLTSALSGEEIPLITVNDYWSDGVDAAARIAGDVSLAAAGKPAGIFYNPALADKSAENVLVFSGRVSSLSDNLCGQGIVAINLGGPKGVLSWRRISDFRRQKQEAGVSEQTEFRLDEYCLSGVHKSGPWTTGLNLKYLSGAVAYQSVISGTPRALISYGYGGGLDLGIIFNPGDNFSAGLSFNNLATFVWWDRYDSRQISEEIRSAITFSPWNFLDLFGEYQRLLRLDGEISRWGLKQKIPKTPLIVGLGEYQTGGKRFFTSGIEIITQKFRLDFARQQSEDKNADEKYLFSLQFAL